MDDYFIAEREADIIVYARDALPYNSEAYTPTEIKYIRGRLFSVTWSTKTRPPAGTITDAYGPHEVVYTRVGRESATCHECNMERSAFCADHSSMVAVVEFCAGVARKLGK